jgi:mannose-1-phosphate guanylyltransferase
LHPDALVVVLPSDHFIANEDAFRATIERALVGAREGYLTTIGIVPTRPETGYGYIELGEGEVANANGVVPAKRFVEKPDRARAEEYLKSGRFLWNAGMFFFRAGAMMEAIRAHMPALGEGLDKIDRAAAAGREAEEVKSVFPTLPAISIDHGVMERAGRVAVVRGEFGWNDVGSWESAGELAPHDAAENAAPAGTVLVDATGNLVRSLSAQAAKKVIALVGVEGLVVVDTDDALLVMPRDRAQDVRAVVDALKARGEAGKL